MKRKNETLVGLVLFMGLATAVLGTLWLQGWEWGRNVVPVEAVFRDIGQAGAGNVVKMRGVRIGRITEVSVLPGGELVQVVLRVDGDIPLPQDAAVVLAPESMFGDWQAEIVPRSEFPHFDFAERPGSDVLPGYALPDISRLTATADRISENLADLTDRIGIAFSEETAQNLAMTIQNIQEVSDRLSELIEQQAATFGEVAAGVEDATGEIGRAAASTRTAFDRLDTILAAGELEGLLADLRQVASGLDGLAEEAAATSREVGGMAGRAESAFDRLDEILELAQSGEGVLGRLLGDPALVDEVEGTLAQLQLLLEDVRENPRRYLRLSIF